MSASIRILHLIAHANSLDILCGDVSNAFVNADTRERCYCRAGPEFGDREGCIILIKKALYGLKSSAERWWRHFADSLRALGFKSTRFDRDVWIKDMGDTYAYVCTHVDDFKIVAKDPQSIMLKLQEKYLIKDVHPPRYYLGNDYVRREDGTTAIGSTTYVKEVLRRLEQEYGTLGKDRTPAKPKDHPEEDETPLLHDDGISLYQQLIGIATWIVLLGRLDICHAVAALNRFNASPREGHLERAWRIFKYLKRYPTKRLIVDSRPLASTKNLKPLDIDFSQYYPDAFEDIDPTFPPPKGVELDSTVYVDSDLGHDRVTRRSLSGILSFVGRLPIDFSSKRMGSVETSTYGAEFGAMRTGVEEAISIRYMLRSLGVPVTKPTVLLGDNMSVIQSSTRPAGVSTEETPHSFVISLCPREHCCEYHCSVSLP
jgi:hypothetical protein